MDDRVTLTVFWMMSFSLYLVFASNKYSETVNNPNLDGYERPFRMSKVNLVWEKAHKRLKGDELNMLFAELKQQDKIELEVKHRRADGLDITGDYDAVVQQKMLDLVLKYGLHDHFEGSSHENNVLSDAKYARKDMMKMDKNVAKIWKKAEMSGFSPDELETFREELHHHQIRIDEYNQLKNVIDTIDGYSDNSLELLKDLNIDMKEAKQKHVELKEKHQQVKDGYLKLEESSKRYHDNSHVFDDPKVMELWRLALKANFTEIELESLKGELKHFELKIQKHDHFKKEKEMLEDAVKSPEKYNNQYHAANLVDIEQKEKDYAYKVKKFHHELKTRIHKQAAMHSEL